MLFIVVFLLVGAAFSEAFLVVVPNSKSKPNHVLSVAPKISRSSVALAGQQGMKLVLTPMKFVRAWTRLCNLLLYHFHTGPQCAEVILLLLVVHKMVSDRSEEQQ